MVLGGLKIKLVGVWGGDMDRENGVSRYKTSTDAWAVVGWSVVIWSPLWD